MQDGKREGVDRGTAVNRGKGRRDHGDQRDGCGMADGRHPDPGREGRKVQDHLSGRVSQILSAEVHIRAKG